MLDCISDRDVLVIIGDWNARVGCNLEEGLWDRVRYMEARAGTDE